MHQTIKYYAFGEVFKYIRDHTAGKLVIADGPLRPLKELCSYTPMTQSADMESHFLSCDQAEVDTLFKEYLAPSLWYSNILALKDGEDFETERIKLCISAAEWVNRTYPYYKRLIDSQASADLMGKLESESVTGFSDMPQSDSFELAPSDTKDKIANITQGRTSTEVATPVERIREIEEKLHPAYAAWAEDFRREFVIL